MELLNKERIMFLSVIAGIIFVGVINSDPVVIKEVPTPAPRTSSLAVGYAQVPKEVKQAKKNLLIDAYKTYALQGTPKLNKELNNLYQYNIVHHWSINKDIQEGDDASLNLWADSYARWVPRSRDEFYTLIERSGYTVEELNEVLKDGTIEEYNEKTQEMIDFLDVYIKEKKNEK